MHIISENKLTDFAFRHSTSRSGIIRWIELIRQNNFKSVNELREIFPHADLVKKENPTELRQRVPYSNQSTTYTVFNIGGNKARLITVIRYNAQQVVIHEVLTHAEYDVWNKKR